MKRSIIGKKDKVLIPLRIDDLNKNQFSMAQIGDAIGFTREHFQQVKSGNKGGSLTNLYNISVVLDCYPSELLPLEWQKPAETINVNVLSKAIEDVFKNAEKDEAELTNEQLSMIIALAYNKEIKNHNSKANVEKIDTENA